MRANRTTWTTVTCPVCEAADVRCEYEPGDPELGISGGVDDFEPECACYDSGLVNTDKYLRRLNESADWSV